MTHIKHIILPLLISLLCLTAKGQVKVVQQLDSMEMLIGEQVHLTISATVPEGKKVAFPDYRQGSNIVPGIEVIEVSTTDRQPADNNLLTLSKTYTLTSFDDTLYYIPALPVVVDGKRYTGKDLALKVMTVEVDTTDKESMLIPFGVQTPPTTFAEWLPVIIGALLLLVCVGLTIYLCRRLKDNKPILRQIRFIRRVPAHQRATKALHKLEHINHRNTMEAKEYYTHLTDILRRYLGEQQRFDAMERTTEEILTHLLRTDIGTHNDTLAPLLRTADLVKFAKYTANNEQRTQHIQQALHYVEQTKDNTVPIEEKKVQEFTPQQQRSQRVRRILKGAITLLCVAATAIVAYIAWQLYWLL